MRVFEWFRDGAVRRIVKFGLPVTIGKAATSVASLIVLALLARHLGPELFGVLAVMRTFVGVVDQYANFNTAQALIKFGSDAMAAKRPRDVERMIKLAVVVDLTTQAIAFAVIAGFALVIPRVFNWDAAQGTLCILYAVTIVTRVSGASDGVFRICDAYRSAAIASAIGSVAIVVAIAVAVALDASFAGCVLASMIGEVISNFIITGASIWAARRAGYGGWWRAPLRGIRAVFPGILRFMLATNAQLSVKRTHSELDTFVVGSMLGKIPSGLFKVVKQLGTIPGRTFMPFEQVLFTELARLAAKDDDVVFARVLHRFTMMVLVGSLASWAVIAVLSEPVIRAAAGEAFIGAAPAFRWYLLGMVLNVANAPVQRATVALGRPGTLFLFDLATLVVLAAAVIIGAQVAGLVGVSLGVVLHKVVQMVWSHWLVARILKGRAMARRVAAQEPLLVANGVDDPNPIV